MSEITVEPFTVTVCAAFGAFVFGMIVGVLLVRSEAKRARRRWREAMRTWTRSKLSRWNFGASITTYRDTTRRSAAKLLTKDEARRIAANIAKQAALA